MMFYNEDWMHFFWTRFNAGVDVDEGVLREYIYTFKNTQITDFAMNVNGTVSSAPSRVLETFTDKYVARDENGRPVDYTNTFAKKAYEIFEQKNIDMYAVWIDALREIGINPWISIRMNDCHGSMESFYVRKSSSVDKGAGYYVSSYRDAVGYFDKCFDYSFVEVRRTLLRYIEEMLDRYDVCGIELDMMREMLFFRAGFEERGRKTMSGLIEDIFVLLNKYGGIYGHPIKLSLILPPHPSDCYDRGIDILSIADKIDYITVISRWETTDTDMPIELWKQLLRGTNIKLGAGQQLLFEPYSRGFRTISSVKMAFGQAIANLSRGSDFVYLYNYMDMGKYEGEIGNWMYDGCIRGKDALSFIFNNIGERGSLLKQSRSHVIAYCDFSAIPKNVHSVLPLRFDGKASYYEMLRFSVGEVPPDKKARLILGINRDDIKAEDFKVYVNSAGCEYIGIVPVNGNIYKNKCYAFNISENFFNIMIAELKISKPCAVEYAEIEIY